MSDYAPWTNPTYVTNSPDDTRQKRQHTAEHRPLASLIILRSHRLKALRIPWQGLKKCRSKAVRLKDEFRGQSLFAWLLDHHAKMRFHHGNGCYLNTCQSLIRC